MAQERKHGLMEKVKEKMPGHHYQPDLSGDPAEETVTPIIAHPRDNPPEPAASADTHSGEKKSVKEKIKEKLTGHHYTGHVEKSTNVHDTSDGRVEDSSIHDNTPAARAGLEEARKNPAEPDRQFFGHRKLQTQSPILV